MANQLNIYVPIREASVNQKVWIQNVDKKPIFIYWGDNDTPETSSDEFISHIYNQNGVYTIFAYYDGVWGDNLDNAITAMLSAGNPMVSIEASDTIIPVAITIQDYPSFTKSALDNSFLNLSLPFSSVDIGSNEFATADNINSVITKLNKNITYLNEQTSVIDPTVPNSFVAWLSGGLGGNIWYSDVPGFSDYYTLSQSVSSFFNNIVDIKVKDFDPLRYIYLIENNSLKILNGLAYNAPTVIQTSTIGFNIPFVSLSALDVDTNGNIFLLDTGIVYKAQYDTINQKVILQTQIGGVGSQSDHYLFSSATDITVDSVNRVYIVDSGNLCIKVYSSDLLWLATITSSFFTVGNKPIKICTDINGNVLVLTTGRDFISFDANLQFVSQVNLLKTANNVSLLTILQNENINKLFADRQNNYLYVVTTNTVIKFTRFGRLINKISNPNSNTLKSLHSGCIDSNNQIFIAKNDRIFQLSDPVVSLSLKRRTVLPIDSSFITLNSDEFVQDWVYNKSIKKLLRNLIILGGSLNQKIVLSFDLDGSLRSFYARPLDHNEKPRIIIDLNNYIGVNEFVLSDVVNRVILAILQQQNAILTALKPSIVFIPSTVPPAQLP